MVLLKTENVSGAFPIRSRFFFLFLSNRGFIEIFPLLFCVPYSLAKTTKPFPFLLFLLLPLLGWHAFAFSWAWLGFLTLDLFSIFVSHFFIFDCSLSVRELLPCVLVLSALILSLSPSCVPFVSYYYRHYYYLYRYLRIFFPIVTRLLLWDDLYRKRRSCFRMFVSIIYPNLSQ